MKKKSDFILIGHLQVMEEPLSSLYSDKKSGLFYLFVRLFEETVESTFVLSEVTPVQVVDYMEGRVGLRSIFGQNKSYYYRCKHPELSFSDFRPLTKENACKKLEKDGLDDIFDKHLSFQMISLKQFLKAMV